MSSQFPHRMVTIWAPTNTKEWKGTISHVILLPSKYKCSPTQIKLGSFFRAGGMSKEGSREGSEDWTVMMGLSTQIQWVHLLVSGIPSAYLRPNSTSQAQGLNTSLLEASHHEQRSPAFTPAQWFSTGNRLPQRTAGNVWTHFQCHNQGGWWLLASSG